MHPKPSLFLNVIVNQKWMLIHWPGSFCFSRIIAFQEYLNYNFKIYFKILLVGISVISNLATEKCQEVSLLTAI